MQLSNIKEFLAKYQEKLTTEEEKQSVILSTLNEIVHGAISKKQCVVAKGIIKLSVSPVIKNEIFMHKEKILLSIREKGRNDIFDIQ